ncbi:MAG: adenylyltransferase/cytidyltransferase family protein [Candidatus Omnitrophota bacterium]
MPASMNTSKKVLTPKKLIPLLTKLKKKRKIIVFTNGCFDILHAGHIKLFEKAKSEGSILIVGLNSDKSVRKIKDPKRPIVNQKDRSLLISSLSAVDYVVLFNELTPENLIRKISPDVLVKGGDWAADKIVGRNLVKKIVRVPLKKGYSTTKIISKIKQL